MGTGSEDVSRRGGPPWNDRSQILAALPVCRYKKSHPPRLVPHDLDYVLLANTFHGVPEKAELSRVVAAILRRGGRFAVVSWHRLPRERTAVLGRPRGPKSTMRMTPAEVREVVEPAGFRLDRVVELPPYHYGAIFLKNEPGEP